MITAPYNFVPLNEEVFYPDWEDKVSHDVPFSDGESGEIEITITAESAIFIRNHYQDGDEFYKDKKENKISKEFCNFKDSNGAKQYYIPGSSIKGMIRNLVEIMSFSEIVIDEDSAQTHLSVRDMTNRRELVGQANGCGFLVEKNGNYIVEDCGKILTISHHELKNNNIYVKKLSTAYEKYTKYGFKQYDFQTYKKMMNVRGRDIPKNMARLDNSSNKKGYLVFTGDINNKKHEFIFALNGKSFQLKDNVAKKFFDVYFKDEDSIDGQYWRNEFKTTKKIPVFYKKDSRGQITDIGLTQLFKLAYNKTIKEAAKQNTQKGKIDLANTIFGYTNDDKALKGRVQFSHLRSNTITYEPQKKSEILGSPNPTYYPNYIEQTDINGNRVNSYKTLMDKDATIRGYKQYPLQKNAHSSQSGNDNEAVKTHFKPLDGGTTFVGKIRFHNLRKAEIGALLSALTFHNQPNNYHNIGMAKSLGYGKIDITLKTDKLQHSKEEYLQAFEKMMDSWDEKDFSRWIESRQIENLFAMHDEKQAKNLNYQLLENPQNRNKNDFTEAKKSREFLQPYIKYKINNKKQKEIPRQNTKNAPKQKPNLEQMSKHFGVPKSKKRGLTIVKKGKG